MPLSGGGSAIRHTRRDQYATAQRPLNQRFKRDSFWLSELRRRHEGERAYTAGDIDSLYAFDAERLQGNGVFITADESVGTGAKAQRVGAAPAQERVG